MPAPIGNEFWKQRSKHGRDKLFQDPELLWAQALEYFDWCYQNPLISVEYYGKDAVECNVPKMRAFTYSGLCNFLDCHMETFHSLKENKDFSDVYARICRIVYTQKLEGAAAGFLNASIIARDLGLVDKQAQAVAVIAGDPETLKAIQQRMNG